MSALFENEQRNLKATVINAGYNFVLVMYQLAGLSYIFSVETYPQADSQKTLPVQNTPVDPETDPRKATNPPTKEEALAYWTSNAQLNADGTRKGGIFGSMNLGLAGSVFIGDTINFDVIENTHKNTSIQINSIENAETKSASACNIKAFACQDVSPQAVVDTPNFVSISGVMYVFVIARGLFAKSQGRVDYPSTETTESIAIAGGGFVGGNQTVQAAHDAETEEEGAKAKDATVMQTFNLPPRSDPTDEPRYCPFSFLSTDDVFKTFGILRSRTNNIQVRYFGELATLPTMYKATDKKEVMAGSWMTVEDFLDLSNDPKTTDKQYVPWIAHQSIVRDAVAEIKKH